MRPGHLELFVSDPQASAEFYRTALEWDLEVVQQDTFIWLKKGNRSLLLRPGLPAPAEAYNSSGLAMVMYCTDLKAELERLAASNVPIAGYDGSPTCPLLRDPDGNWIQLVEYAG